MIDAKTAMKIASDAVEVAAGCGVALSINSNGEISAIPKVNYICNQQACENCMEIDACTHTTKIEFADNFEVGDNGTYWEIDQSEWKQALWLHGFIVGASLGVVLSLLTVIFS